VPAVGAIEGINSMKRLLAVVGVIALLATVSVVATSSPSAAAEPIRVNVENTDVSSTIDVTFTGCGWTDGPHSVAPSSAIDVELNGGCVLWSVIGVDQLGQCTVLGDYGIAEVPDGRGVSVQDGEGTPFPRPPGNVLSDMITPDGRWFLNFDTEDCVSNNDLRIDKNMEYELDEFAGNLMTWDFTITAVKFPSRVADDGACGGSNTTASIDGVPDNSTEAVVSVLNGYIHQNQLIPCVYAVTETVPIGWTLTGIDFDDNDSYCAGPDFRPAHDSDYLPTHDNDSATAWVAVQYNNRNGSLRDYCEIDFYNALDPVPLVVTKTFTGRDYYTTIDRADFHIYTPGLCGTFPMDPFGGLLGSVGVFRTINASQLPQVVAALPNTIVAGPNGPCTYRVQENNAPEGCTAMDPTGSNADGPYWEQTWVPGETTEFTFNIVNDCAEAPEPTPEPTVAPTSTPKKPGAKKPSGGGSAAPKFTG
jgi:hypothetical protein